jgi:hypothetical protein
MRQQPPARSDRAARSGGVAMGPFQWALQGMIWKNGVPCTADKCETSARDRAQINRQDKLERDDESF